jgi:hypothetical protein
MRESGADHRVCPRTRSDKDQVYTDRELKSLFRFRFLGSGGRVSFSPVVKIHHIYVYIHIYVILYIYDIYVRTENPYVHIYVYISNLLNGPGPV